MSIIREYGNNAPVYTINGNVIQNCAGNIPVYTVGSDNVIREYSIGNTPLYTIGNDNIIRKYSNSAPLFIIDNGSSSTPGASSSSFTSTSSSDNSEKFSIASLIGIIIGFVIFSPIGNIILGLFFGFFL
jgi:hypothetical protein